MFLFCCDHFIIAVTVVGHRRQGLPRGKSDRRHEPENWRHGTFLTATSDWNEQLKYKSDTINVEKKTADRGSVQQEQNFYF